MNAGGPEQAAEDLLERWYVAWNAHDVKAILDLTTEDVLYEDPSSAVPVMRGKAEVEASIRASLRGVPDLHLEKRDVWVTPGGEVIASWFGFSGTFTGPLALPGRPVLSPTGLPIVTNGMDRSEIRDGLLCRHQIFWDMLDVARQMTLLPARDSGMDRLGYKLQGLRVRRMRSRRRA